MFRICILQNNCCLYQIGTVGFFSVYYMLMMIILLCQLVCVLQKQQNNQGAVFDWITMAICYYANQQVNVEEQFREMGIKFDNQVEICEGWLTIDLVLKLDEKFVAIMVVNKKDFARNDQKHELIWQMLIKRIIQSQGYDVFVINQQEWLDLKSNSYKQKYLKSLMDLNQQG
eukprot:TRINITY_DN20532_c0_g1_i2.p2 TRINITY_DN20532_c0_g1~~TRINITY_DN20532_c0_g1_i2.p2  ORF type:complete len:172 (+),score=11.69 TRINITY_DN20532_c0_g1_i2:112-627(+)